ncbi:hypothetical protein HL658_30895 [Azospirillum sp. RWY-5-1]|uniref:Uncharacterized protein n=1 Tax=Azospirillum oleiclasticum TaxID=2735135 RepID=A0ABX2TJR0_9PROT|nr:hypothetical protein [Azospirillum oleiclasticum]NYZ16972.1 hypothetical protein [Azospirillum oleiclasticum]NYZ24585.1 hypothetical protein [Azospirillum oleiclasticum]
MADRPTAQKGTGGSGGASCNLTDYVVPARRLRLPHPPANDNRVPLRRKIVRAAIIGALLAASVAVLVTL